MKPSNKVVVITGVSRGLGRAMAERFIAGGCTVAGCARSAGQVQALQRQFGDPHFFSALDVSDDAAVSSWAATVIHKFGAPDLLINNAAVINPNAPLWKVSAADFDRVVDVNIKGTANMIRHFAPAMVKKGRGVIVNFSSGWGRSTDAEVAPYCASKFAIEGLTQALAQELPDGMAAVPLNPGIIDTSMLRSCFGESASSYPSPEEWAKVAVPFILAIGRDDNGQSLTVE